MTNLTDQELKKKLETIDANNRKLDALRYYDGEDRVITVSEAKNEIALTPRTLSIKSGVSEIDNALDGFRGGEVVVVSGPTGQGKTTFLQSLTYTFTVPTLWFSYEVGLADFLERFGLNVPSFTLPKTTKSNDVKWLETRIWEAKAKHNVKVVFVDHLHFLIPFDALMGNSSLAIGHFMREIKRIAIETDTVIFLVSHLKKTEVEKVPTISDLRDSSFIGQEADIVMLVWRETQDGLERYTDNAFLKIEKNRRKGTLKYWKMQHVNSRFHIFKGGETNG